MIEIKAVSPPTFFSMDPDGSIWMEWCIGEQGANNSWRINYTHDLEEGVNVWDTRMDGSGKIYSGHDALVYLRLLLTEAGKLI